MLTSSTGLLDIEVLAGRYALGFAEEGALGLQQGALLTLARSVIAKLPSAG